MYNQNLAYYQRKLTKKGDSTKALSEKTGEPVSPIRKFEKTGEIYFRQFLMIYAEIGKLTELQKLTQLSEAPKNLDEELKDS